MAADAEVWAVLSSYALDRPAVRSIEPLGSGGGWSGSRLWRVVDERGIARCLRRWPLEHPSEDRLRLIHRVLLGAQAGGIDYVPPPLMAAGGKTFVEHGGHFWELAPWLRGRADLEGRPSEARLGAAMKALAGFHRAAAKVMPVERSHAPAITERAERIAALGAGGLQAIGAAVSRGLLPELDRRAHAILQLAPSLLVRIEPCVEAARRALLPLQPAIRDIHRDHVLFTGDEVTGIVDFGALRIDTPLADIARLVGSLAGDDAAGRRTALDAYAEVIPLSEADYMVIELLDESGILLGGMNWLQWLYVERRDMGELAPIAERLDEMIGRLTRRRGGAERDRD